MPFRRTWFRYMPVMPATASAANTTLRYSLTFTFADVMEVVVSWGWPIWTAMKMVPPAIAATAAARVSPDVVTVTANLPAALADAVGAQTPERRPSRERTQPGPSG